MFNDILDARYDTPSNFMKGKAHFKLWQAWWQSLCRPPVVFTSAALATPNSAKEKQNKVRI
jgi:hypothetical protein